jgi:ketosteroid isomerase-like protein
VKRISTVAIFIIVTTSLALGQATNKTAGQSGGAEEEVKRLLEEYSEALLRRDIGVLERIWADDFTFTNPMGSVLSKAQRIANIKSSATSLTSVTVNDQDVRAYGDAVVATNRITLEGRYSGQEGSGQYRTLGVWVKRQGRWQMVALQMTRIAAEK